MFRVIEFIRLVCVPIGCDTSGSVTMAKPRQVVSSSAADGTGLYGEGGTRGGAGGGDGEAEGGGDGEAEGGGEGEADGGGEGEADGGGGDGEADGGGGHGASRGPQSAQSAPYSQMVSLCSPPPSSQ